MNDTTAVDKAPPMQMTVEPFKPTMNLVFIYGVLHQKFVAGDKFEWRPVPQVSSASDLRKAGGQA